MLLRGIDIIRLLGFALLASGCAADPELMARRAAVDADISAVLKASPDASEQSSVRQCLNGAQYSGFRVLDDRHILFEGVGNRRWLNTLPFRCPDLRFAESLRIKSSFSFGRICAMDRFVPEDWFYRPWYRRWPWRWSGTWGSGVTCVLGKFEPVTAPQVDAILHLLKNR